MKRPTSFFHKFGKNQLSALIATAIDYLALLCLVEILHLHYLSSVAVASLLGAVTNFTLNRLWVFKSSSRLWRQMTKYAIVSGMSLAWNVILVGMLVEGFKLNYFISKIIVSLMVSILWNYTLHRYFVFRVKAHEEKYV